jgi:flagellar biosynthesis GTPase FlhF
MASFRRRKEHMKTRIKSWLFLLAVVLGMASFVATRAAADDEPEQDPPGRVARLSYVNGQVSFSPSGTDDWVAAVVNRPITTGDKLWTDQNSRAELHIGSSVARIGDLTGFSFLNLDDHTTQVRLTEGALNLHVIRLGENETIEVDTPNLAFSILRPGHYRVNVNEAGDTSIINVRDGEGEVTGGGSAYTLHPGDQGIFTGTDTLSSDVEPLPAEDSFDSWCDERDLREEHAAARRYVSDDVVGYEDLDDYGGWRPVPAYGTVWFPHVAVVGWAPYRFGHWVWISPWGWTWVDDAPWGFAPFHYGRWVFVGGAWGWVPAPRPVVAVAYVRPVYAPALVAWVGGPHFAAGVAFGGGVGFATGVNVGWFPLGPREVFVPSYPVSRTYVNNVNISNTTVNQTVINNYYNNTIVNKNVTVNNVKYVNQSVPGGVTATSGQAFTSAQPVGRNMVAVNQREISSAPVAVRAPAVTPPKQAVLGAGAATNVHPPAAIASRQVVAKTTPPPPPPSFAARQAAIEKNQGQPLSTAQTHQLATTQTHANVAPVKMAPPSKPATPVYNQQGSRANDTPGPLHTNRPANAQSNNQSYTPNNNANRPNNTQNTQNGKSYQDRPPTSRPTSATVNPQLEEKHQQQIQQLQQKQDQQYQKLQQKQTQEQQKLQQQNANEEKQQQVQQQHQQQLENMQQQHQQQQQQLQQKQQAEHEKAKDQSKPAKEEKHK